MTLTLRLPWSIASMINNLGRLDAKSYQKHDDGDKVGLLTTSLSLNPLAGLSTCEDFAECILTHLLPAI
jgi:hypothetical protein